MQTFLPYPDFEKSAKCLDNKRLGKQRVEVLQILNVLLGKSKGNGWKNHPAVKMWKFNPYLLLNYGIAICEEWKRRGFRDTVHEKLWKMGEEEWGDLFNAPKFSGHDFGEDFHRSHRSNLTRKFPEWYNKYWNEPNDLPYVWPVK